MHNQVHEVWLLETTDEVQVSEADKNVQNVQLESRQKWQKSKLTPELPRCLQAIKTWMLGDGRDMTLARNWYQMRIWRTSFTWCGHTRIQKITRSSKPMGLNEPNLKQDHQALHKAKYCPRIAAVSCTQKNTKNMWPWPLAYIWP